MPNKAVIAGASGLIGSYLLNILLQADYYEEVLVLVRKELPITHEKLMQLIIDFDKLEDHAAAITGHAVFCCLGTIKKRTTNLNDYRKIDYGYPLELAQLADRNRIKHYHLVSLTGANPKSTNYYTRFKGEVEKAVKKTGIKCIHIYEPSVLTGVRKEHRPLDPIVIGLMKLIDPLLIGGFKKYRTIAAQTVAQAMYKQSLKSEEGIFVHSSDKIKLLA